MLLLLLLLRYPRVASTWNVNKRRSAATPTPQPPTTYGGTAIIWYSTAVIRARGANEVTVAAVRQLAVFLVLKIDPLMMNISSDREEEMGGNGRGRGRGRKVMIQRVLTAEGLWAI